MNDNEVMGLIGELLFMQDYMIPHYGVETALDSWMGPEKIIRIILLGASGTK